MNETAILEAEGEQIEWSVEVPHHEETVACDACGHRSYYHVLVGSTLMSYCLHHTNKYEERLSKAGTVLADYREKIDGIKT